MSHDAEENLKRLFPKGSTVFLILRHRNRSGTSREIGIVSISSGSLSRDGTVIPSHPDYDVAEVLEYRLNERGDGIIVRGGGMDMGLHVVDALSRHLYGESRALRHQWL